MSELSNVIAKDIETLKQSRDELRVQLHLAKKEAKDRFFRLENKWHEIETRGFQARRASGDSLKKIATTTRTLVDEIRTGYEEIRTSLRIGH